MANIVFWILFGGLVGWLASLIMKTGAEQGIIGNILVGIAGALAGGFASMLLGGPGISGFNIVSIVIATIGAVLLLFILKPLRD